MNVDEIQNAFLALGSYSGLIDGDLGPRTRKAVEAFQTNHRLKAGGIVGLVTLGSTDPDF